LNPFDVIGIDLNRTSGAVTDLICQVSVES
jgi:hypothetical protein